MVAIDANSGKIVPFGIPPQNRFQTHGTLPLLFKALYWPAEGDLQLSGPVGAVIRLDNGYITL